MASETSPLQPYLTLKAVGLDPQEEDDMQAEEDLQEVDDNSNLDTSITSDDLNISSATFQPREEAVSPSHLSPYEDHVGTWSHNTSSFDM